MQPTKVLVVDDHELIRRGICALLENERDFVVVAEATCGEDALQLAARLEPEIVIMDLNLPGLNGFDATRKLLEIDPATQVLILTALDAPQITKQVLAAGARGYVLKSDIGSDLVSALTALSRNECYLTNRASEIIVADLVRNRDPDFPVLNLTERERLLVQLLFDGKSNKEIAAELGISVRTVETHRKNIMAKLGVRSLGELFRHAIRGRIIRV